MLVRPVMKLPSLPHCEVLNMAGGKVLDHGQNLRPYLCQFAHEHVDFRLPELKSMLSLFQIKHEMDETKYSLLNPFIVVNLSSEDDVKKILSRSVLVRFMYEVWGVGETFQELCDSIKAYPSEYMKPFCSSESTFKIRVDSFNKTYSFEEQKKLINSLDFLPFEGKVKLKNPDHELCLILDHGDREGPQSPENPCRLFLGRNIGQGQRHLINKFSLKERHFIGNTSMDAQLSFLMANMGQAKTGALIYDPFVGTGSVLVSCAHFGAYVAGNDIDSTLLRGRGRPSRAQSKEKWRGKDESVLSNFKQYGLQGRYLDVLIADSGRLKLRQQTLFNSIITDPPYGIREGARKLGALKEQDEKVQQVENDENGEMPSVQICALSDVMMNLLEFAAKHLELHGRLVYWLPVYRPEYNDDLVPAHPCFKVLFNSEQILSKHVSRRLITMEKVRMYKEGDEYCLNEAMFRLSHDRFRDNYFSKPNQDSLEEG